MRDASLANQGRRAPGYVVGGELLDQGQEVLVLAIDEDGCFGAVNIDAGGRLRDEAGEVDVVPALQL